MSFTGTYYRGHDLLTEMPNDSTGDRDEGETIASDVVDSTVGQVAITRAWAGPVLTRPHTFTLTTRYEVNDFLWWCALRRGQYKPLWVPTWRRDFTLSVAAGASDTDLIVEDTGYTESQFPDESRRHLAVIISGGGTRTVYARRITDAVDNGDGTETLTLESAVGVAVDQYAVLSFLVLARLDADDIPIEWFHLGAAEASVRFVEIPREVEG